MTHNFALDYVIRKVHANQYLKLNGTHQLLVYADGINILGGCVNTPLKNTEALIGASKENILAVNAEKTKWSQFRPACRTKSHDKNVY